LRHCLSFRPLKYIRVEQTRKTTGSLLFGGSIAISHTQWLTHKEALPVPRTK